MSEYKLPFDLNGVHIHFVGIKGTGMAALTEILCARGATITGSDVADVFYTDKVLQRCGINPTLFAEENITDSISCVVYSSAYNANSNCELAKANQLGIPCLLYSDALGQLSANAYSCGIAGVHGKTTTTGLTGTIIHGLGIKAQVLAGSVISSFGEADGEGSCTMTDGSDYFVAETCEYQRHFMAFHPKKIILTSVESDHQDYYPTYNDIRDAFVDYACLLPQNGELIYCADDAGAMEVAQIVSKKRDDIKLTPYGITAKGNYHISFGDVCDGHQYFYLDGFKSYKFALKMPGKHLVLNASAGIALAVSILQHETNQSEDVIFTQQLAEKISNALLNFRGGKRRTELVGQIDSVIFLDDYGHHPTAIKTTLEGYRAFYPNRKIIVDFMSHTYTRTAALLEEFASSFSAADKVILHKIYGSARENASATGITGKTLFESTKKYHKDVSYYEEIMDAYEPILLELSKKDSDYPDGTIFVTMGAGDNWKLGKALFQQFSKNI